MNKSYILLIFLTCSSTGLYAAEGAGANNNPSHLRVPMDLTIRSSLVIGGTITTTNPTQRGGPCVQKLQADANFIGLLTSYQKVHKDLPSQLNQFSPAHFQTLEKYMRDDLGNGGSPGQKRSLVLALGLLTQDQLNRGERKGS